MKILTFDPSGNKGKEGDGTTGWSFFKDGELKDFGDIAAKDYECIESYWNSVLRLIVSSGADVVVCESFKLQPGKAMQQSWSAMETSQLIGTIRMVCWKHKIKIVFQDPACKVRVADPILEHLGVIEKRGKNYYCQGRMTNLHMRDAIRHGVFYHKYGKD